MRRWLDAFAAEPVDERCEIDRDAEIDREADEKRAEHGAVDRADAADQDHAEGRDDEVEAELGHELRVPGDQRPAESGEAGADEPDPGDHPARYRRRSPAQARGWSRSRASPCRASCIAAAGGTPSTAAATIARIHTCWRVTKAPSSFMPGAMAKS